MFCFYMFLCFFFFFMFFLFFWFGDVWCLMTLNDLGLVFDVILLGKWFCGEPSKSRTAFFF